MSDVVHVACPVCFERLYSYDAGFKLACENGHATDRTATPQEFFERVARLTAAARLLVIGIKFGDRDLEARRKAVAAAIKAIDPDADMTEIIVDLEGR